MRDKLNLHFKRNFKKLFKSYFEKFKGNYKAICFKPRNNPPKEIKLPLEKPKREKTVESLKTNENLTVKESNESEESDSKYFVKNEI